MGIKNNLIFQIILAYNTIVRIINIIFSLNLLNTQKNGKIIGNNANVYYSKYNLTEYR